MYQQKPIMSMDWGRFTAMIATSGAIMFFLMYQLIYKLDHAEFSLNRFLAAIIMACVMTAVMLGFMWSMYRGRTTKIIVFAGSIVVALALLVVNRSQIMVDDVRFMQAMIPHHSIAINNARKARITDPRVRKLADGIIESQVKEIAEMKRLVADIKRNGSRGDRPIPAQTAKVTSDMVPQIEEAVK